MEIERNVVQERNSNWASILHYKVSILPLSIYVPFLLVACLLMSIGKFPKDMLGALPVMILLGFGLAEIGNRIPLFNSIGGSTILSVFVPSYMVAHKIMAPAMDVVTNFMKTNNFLYIFISIVVVGSIFGMNRIILIQGFLRMFVPLFIGTIVAVIVGVATGSLLGLGAFKTFFYIVIPIMAGGIGEGSLPLSIAYAEILKADQAQLLGQIVPAAMIGSLSAIILAGMLKRLGQRKPQYSGNGALTLAGDDDILKHQQTEDKSIDVSKMGVGVSVALCIYLLGIYVGSLTGLPGPIVMIFLAALCKVLNIVPKGIEDGAYQVYRFFAVVVTFPLLAAVGIVYTPWKDLIEVISPAYIITVFITVLAMITSGFFVAKYLKMHPIETAIVTGCHSGLGGTGDVAILTASDRMNLMPFAQISTRIGGAITVTIATILLKMFH